MAGHTPGPWTCGVEHRDGCRKVSTPDEYILAMVNFRAYRRQEGMADAHLIAAAPDLLAALKAVEWVDDSDWGPICPWCGVEQPGPHVGDCQGHAAIAKATGAEELHS